jgi:hypothetical protein
MIAIVRMLMASPSDAKPGDQTRASKSVESMLHRQDGMYVKTTEAMKVMC